MTTPGTLDYYLGLITSEYSSQPNAMATVEAVVQPKVDTIAFLQNLWQYFQLDSAVGDQLDKLGAWLGVSRNVSETLTGVYFELDSSTLGLDQGSMQGEFDPSTGLVSLPDDTYRKIIEAFRFLNHNKCTLPLLHEALDPFFTAGTLVIQNMGNFTVFYGLTARPASEINAQLFLQGYLSFVPAGCNGIGNLITSPDTTVVPFFGLDYENNSVSGFDSYMV